MIHGEDPGELNLGKEEEKLDGELADVRQVIGPILKRMEAAAESGQSLRLKSETIVSLMTFIADVQNMGLQNMAAMQVMGQRIAELEFESKKTKKKFWTP